MSYGEFFELFSNEIHEVGLGSVFSPNWLSDLNDSLPDEPNFLEAPEFAFFAIALQVHAQQWGNPNAFHSFMEDVAKKIAWIKTKNGGSALAKKLAQASPDGPISALMEIYSGWKISTKTPATLVELDSVLSDGKNLDAKYDVNGEQFLVECYASMTNDLATNGTLDGYWNPEADPTIPKIQNKILDKADQAESSTLPVIVLFAPGADFLVPPEKIPLAVNAAFDRPKCKTLSAVALTGGSHTFLCENVALVIENPNASMPLGQNAKKVLGTLLSR